MGWYDEDDLWERFAVAMFSKDRIASAAREVDEVLGLLGLAKGASVVDLCCGPGRHALELARRGYSVTAVDRTEAYLRRAEESAKKERLTVELVRSDMREFERAQTFDAALSLFTSFGFFEDPADDARVVEHLYASLRPGGRVLIDVRGKEIIARSFRARDWTRLEDGSILLEERALQPGWSGVTSKWILIAGSDRFERVIHLRLYSGVELSALLSRVGFVDVECFGSFRGTPYDENAERLIVRARRAGTPIV